MYYLYNKVQDNPPKTPSQINDIKMESHGENMCKISRRLSLYCKFSILQMFLINLIFADFILLAMGQNSQSIIDTSYPIVFTDQFRLSNLATSVTPSSSHFGFSAQFVKPFVNQSESNNYPKAWLFIGAPKGTSNDRTYPSNTLESGVIWRCSLDGRPGTLGRVAETCEILHLDPEVPNRARSQNGQCSFSSCQDFPYEESKNQTWVGGNIMALENEASGSSPPGRFVSCAHHWTRASNVFMNGLCYFFQPNDVNQLPRNINDNFMKDKIDLRSFRHRLIPFFERQVEGAKTNQYFNVTGVVGMPDGGDGVKWAVGQSGISFHLFREKDSRKVELLLGAPGVYIWAGGVVRYQDGIRASTGSLERKNARGSNDFRQYMISARRNSERQNWYSYFGYAVTSGHYNISRNQLLYVAGAPRANYLQGEVVIFDFPAESGQSVQELYVLKPKENNDQTGSYFGSVLLTVDFNNDGYDDLFVAAPTYSKNTIPVRTNFEKSGSTFNEDNKEGDEGCVYFYSSEREFREEILPRTLIGESQPGARFGSAISNIGDIDGDKLTDVAIGAPYQDDGSGVVYIYLGRKDDTTITQRIIRWNQKIEASSIILPGLGQSLRGFGISITSGDIDENETPDIAIGSYASDQLVILRTRPSIQISASMSFEIEVNGKLQSITVLPKTGTRFTINSCLRFDKKFGKPAPAITLNAMIAVDQSQQNRRFSLVLNDVSTFAPRKITNYTFEYSEELKYGEMKCRAFAALRNSDYPEYKNDEIPPIKIDVNVIQESQFKNTTTVLVRHHKIVNSGSGSRRNNDPNTAKVEVEGALFDDFCPYCTYFTELQTSFPLPVSNCLQSDCKSELRISGGFRLENNAEMIDRFTIGSSRRLILFVVVTNDGDSAALPKLNIQWEASELKISLKPSECPDEPIIDARTSISTFNCFLGNSLRNEKNKTIQITFDVSSLTVHSQNHFLSIFTEASSTNDKATQHAKKTFELNMTPDTKLDIIIRPSAIKEIFSLTAPFDHYYQVSLTGTSTVGLVELKFKIPTNATIKGHSKRIARLFRASYLDDVTRVSCEIPQDFYTQVEEEGKGDASSSSSGSGSTIVSAPPKKPSEGTEVDYFDSQAMPDGELESQVKRVKRELGKNNEEVKRNSRFMGDILTPPESHEILIQCDDEASSLNVDCVEITCSAINMAPEPQAIFIGFSLQMDELAMVELLDSSEKTSILFRTHGIAEIRGLQLAHSTSGQTIINAGHQSEPVATWIFVVAAIVGFIVLAVIVFCLYKFGFFRREKKEQLNELLAQRESFRQSMKSRMSIPQEPASEEDGDDEGGKEVVQKDSANLVPNEVDNQHRVSSMTVVTEEEGDDVLTSSQNDTDQQKKE